MTEKEFIEKATELIKQIVNAIADKKYTALASLAKIDLNWSSWLDLEETPESACLGFGQWLEEQLAMWEEDEQRSFVVDHFDESCLEEIKLWADNTSSVTYFPTNSGERLDFVFEIDLKIDQNNEIIAALDVNA